MRRAACPRAKLSAQANGSSTDQSMRLPGTASRPRPYWTAALLRNLSSLVAAGHWSGHPVPQPGLSQSGSQQSMNHGVTDTVRAQTACSSPLLAGSRPGSQLHLVRGPDPVLSPSTLCSKAASPRRQVREISHTQSLPLRHFQLLLLPQMCNVKNRLTSSIQHSVS